VAATDHITGARNGQAKEEAEVSYKEAQDAQEADAPQEDPRVVRPAAAAP
jgi:hypothetical protein